MNRTCLFFSTVFFSNAGLFAQTQPGIMSYQAAQTLAAGRGGRGTVIPIPRAEKGKPFSATVTTETVQTLIDGTHVGRTTTMVQYRDVEGRTRIETTAATGNSAAPTKVIMIRDAVAGVTYRLDPATKAAVKTQAIVNARGGAGAANALLLDDTLANLEQTLRRTMEGAHAAAKDPNFVVDDLGTMVINGVPAQGTRMTTIVRAGSIGNDRDFRSVDERWFSSDLNLLIKSVATDPRFGTTVYELTNINRQSPDPALFQVPGDYTISAGGVGRGVAEGVRQGAAVGVGRGRQF